jgi:hypothetical protein
MVFSGLYSFHLQNGFNDYESIYSIVEKVFKESFENTDFEFLYIKKDLGNPYIEFFFKASDLEAKISDMRVLPKVLKRRTTIAMKKLGLIDFNWGSTQLLQTYNEHYEKCKEEFLLQLAYLEAAKK